MPDYLTVLDLFSGPGGLSQGIKDSRNHNFRFKVVVANDNNCAVENTYTKNHPDVEFILGSITSEETKQKILTSIMKKTGRSTVDVVIGGPPCKGFSLENKITRNMQNPLNHLVNHYLEMVKRVNPTAFIMENVPGLIAMNDKKFVKSLIQKFKSHGYLNTTSWLLNAADYGVPQFRKRAFVIGSKSNIPIIKPKKTHGTIQEKKINNSLKPYMTLMDAISDLPKITPGSAYSSNDNYVSEPKNQFQNKIRKKSRIVKNHIITINKPLIIERIKHVPSGGNWKNIPERLMKVDGNYNKLELAHSMIYKRLLKFEPSITITNFRKGMIIHPSQHRLLSVREAARIQTFPDHFEFKGGLSNMQQQVSDAVPTHLAKAVGNVVLSHLHEIIPMKINSKHCD